MKISFARNLSDIFFTADWPSAAIRYAAQLAKVRVNISRSRIGRDDVARVTCTLDDPAVEATDRFLNAVFGLDPDAKVKTARAIYEDASDFLAAKAARV